MVAGELVVRAPEKIKPLDPGGSSNLGAWFFKSVGISTAIVLNALPYYRDDPGILSLPGKSGSHLSKL